MTTVLRSGGGAGESLAQQCNSPVDEVVALPSESHLPSVSSSSVSRPSSSTGRSPRCEAFVMTGDKILNLNPNISPSYAKVARDQLPPRMSIHDSSSPRSASALLSHQMNFPSTKRGRIHSSISQPEDVKINRDSSVSKMARVAMPEEERENGGGGERTMMERREDEEEERDENREAADDSSVATSLYRSMHSSNPAMVTRDTRTCSSETFVMAPETPSKMSSVTVNGVCPPSVQHTPSHDMRVVPTSPGSSVAPTRSSSISRWITHAVLSPWSGMRIDAALREFIAQVELKGETSAREQIITHFSRRYFYANTTSFSNFDEVHGLACGLLLLNSDLHSAENSKKMSSREFINNMAHMGHEYGKPLLKALYQSIKDEPLVYAGARSAPDRKKKTRAHNSAPLEMDPRSQIEYKRGYLMRKIVYDSDGTPTPFGRRGWRMLYVRVRALALYFSRDENEPPLYNALSGAVLLHHSLAERANDYCKRKNVFRLRTAGLGEILFQASSESDVSSWIHSLNLVSASFSSPSLPPAINNRGEIVWPVLPKMPSSASVDEQIALHEHSLCALRKELERLHANAPPVRSKGREVEKYFFNQRLLMLEISRYETYITLLRSRLDGHSSDSGIVSKASNVDDGDRLSYREAMH
ncbi:hypothetical protein PFISCL1PPCAC_16356 [Pristionchus fissidentatus]|uniref:Uncharacterized protein n=1 Tax=Pristionchus fissidentatus TaxID=1538716 RepID=A0AAV5W5B5_9BILA|nr:hypothetical protein PFISCL1PPCAC_16356 [Pristionchus fissidentatus]